MGNMLLNIHLLLALIAAIQLHLVTVHPSPALHVAIRNIGRCGPQAALLQSRSL